jgi:choline kinase
VNALILAAGRGTRLGGDNEPKCLTRVGGAALIDRYLDAFAAMSVPVTIVVGHLAHKVETHVASRRQRPTLVTNPRYVEGSILSLIAGLEKVGTHESLLLCDGDVAFAPELLTQLRDAPAPDALLVDVGTEFTDEQFMAGMRGGRVAMLRRGTVDGHETQGEWIGFSKLSAASAARFLAATKAQAARGETEGGYEDALGGLLGDIAFSCVPTNGLPWIEIDFTDDLKRAKEMFR